MSPKLPTAWPCRPALYGGTRNPAHCYELNKPLTPRRRRPGGLPAAAVPWRRRPACACPGLRSDRRCDIGEPAAAAARQHSRRRVLVALTALHLAEPSAEHAKQSDYRSSELRRSPLLAGLGSGFRFQDRVRVMVRVCGYLCAAQGSPGLLCRGDPHFQLPCRGFGFDGRIP